MVDDDAANLKVTDAARLSRLHWEDVLRVNEGGGVVVYFRHDVAMLREVFENYPKKAALKQKDMGAGHIAQLNGKKFLVLKAVMAEAQM